MSKSCMAEKIIIHPFFALSIVVFFCCCLIWNMAYVPIFSFHSDMAAAMLGLLWLARYIPAWWLLSSTTMTRVLIGIFVLSFSLDERE
jgi:hypothetical protein